MLLVRGMISLVYVVCVLVLLTLVKDISELPACTTCGFSRVLVLLPGQTTGMSRKDLQSLKNAFLCESKLGVMTEIFRRRG